MMLNTLSDNLTILLEHRLSFSFGYKQYRIHRLGLVWSGNISHSVVLWIFRTESHLPWVKFSYDSIDLRMKMSEKTITLSLEHQHFKYFFLHSFQDCIITKLLNYLEQEYNLPSLNRRVFIGKGVVYMKKTKKFNLSNY